MTSINVGHGRALLSLLMRTSMYVDASCPTPKVRLHFVVPHVCQHKCACACLLISCGITYVAYVCLVYLVCGCVRASLVRMYAYAIMYTSRHVALFNQEFSHAPTSSAKHPPLHETWEIFVCSSLCFRSTATNTESFAIAI